MKKMAQDLHLTDFPYARRLYCFQLAASSQARRPTAPRVCFPALLEKLRLMHGTAGVLSSPTTRKAYQDDEHLTISVADSCISTMLVVKYYRKLIDVQHLAGAKVFVTLGTLGLHLQAKTMMVYYVHAYRWKDSGSA
jgi:hypothetical protein